MKPPHLVNGTCSKCSTPLFAFEQQKDGSVNTQSFGVSVRLNQPGPALAICPKCGHHEPFDRKLLPGG